MIKERCLKYLKEEQWSPAQISGYLRNEGIHVSHETIYKWIRDDKQAGGSLYTHLRHKGKHRKRFVGICPQIKHRMSIHEHSKEANGKRFGDWEMDKINRRPREKLNFSTPTTCFFQYFNYLCTCLVNLYIRKNNKEFAYSKKKMYLCKAICVGMLFREIIGQDFVKNRLRMAAKEKRIPHAFLLSGPEGVGKLQLAVAFAQYVNCPNHSDNDACDSCPTCKQFSNLQHPDLHFAFPIVKTSEGDVCDDFIDDFRKLFLDKHYFNLNDWYKTIGVETKQGVIYEKESSEILRKLSLKSFGDGYKFMIIWQPEKMNVTCANKLLKLLEEPPLKTVFILVSEHPDQLLPTILSRVQQISVPKLDEDLLVSHFDADIAHIANGSYLNAIKIFSDIEERQHFFDDFVTLMRRAWLVGHQKNYAALQELRDWSLKMADTKVGREKQKAFLQFAQTQVRENYVYPLNLSKINYLTDNESKFANKFAPFINENNVENIMKELDKAEQQIAQNGNAKIIFFDLCLQMIVLIKK